MLGCIASFCLNLKRGTSVGKQSYWLGLLLGYGRWAEWDQGYWSPTLTLVETFPHFVSEILPWFLELHSLKPLCSLKGWKHSLKIKLRFSGCYFIAGGGTLNFAICFFTVVTFCSCTKYLQAGLGWVSGKTNLVCPENSSSPLEV